jgi:hypothetical protein
LPFHQQHKLQKLWCLVVVEILALVGLLILQVIRTVTLASHVYSSIRVLVADLQKKHTLVLVQRLLVLLLVLLKEHHHFVSLEQEQLLQQEELQQRVEVAELLLLALARAEILIDAEV